MLNKTLIAYTLLTLSYSAYAVEPPLSAGSLVQQLPPAPIPPKASPKFEVQKTAPLAAPKQESAKIIVKQLKITGAKAYSEAELLAVTGFKPGSYLSLSELRGMATKISDFYHQNGYFVAQAYLPAQDIANGVVTISVIIGKYGKITVNNQTNVSNNLVNDILDGVNEGDLVSSDTLENRLLLLSDLPGVRINSNMTPGASLGASDLKVNVKPGQRVTGSIDADNAGNQYTGSYRGGGTINFNEPFGHGDVASLRVLTAGSGLNYGRALYQMQFGKANVGVAYSYLQYKLGKQFKPLDAHGSLQIASIYGNYPLIRSRNNNLYAQVGFDEKIFQDKTGSTATVANKQAHVLRTGLYGDYRDDFGFGSGYGGLNTYSLFVSSGFIDLQNSDVRAADAATARTNGYYNKIAFYLSRLQSVTDYISLFASINGQVATKNLDVSEKMELGGLYAVRAYPEGEAYADQGFVFTFETRFLIPRFIEKMPGDIQLVGFVDTGLVNTYQNPWVSGSNTRNLSGAGAGINWFDYNNFGIRAYYAHRIGHDQVLSGQDRSGQFWVQAVKYF